MKKNIIRTAVLSALLFVSGLSASAQQKSYNVPELTRDKVGVTRNTLRECIYASDGEKARYVR